MLIVGIMVATPTLAEQSNEELAMQLSNPVAALISVPLQLNHDSHVGPDRSGTRTLLNIQPVVPFSLNAEWNLISRTILPIVWQDNIFAGAGSQSGFGDVVQSLFFSPKAPTSGGWIWGAGPVFLLPVGSNDLLTADKWGAGPTAVVLKQDGQWTYGALANQIWSFAGNGNRADVSAAFVQPFLTYTTHTATSLIVNTESLYDWKQQAVVGADQCGRHASPSVRKPVAERRRPGALLGRQPGQWPARLGLQDQRHAALSSLMDRHEAAVMGQPGSRPQAIGPTHPLENPRESTVRAPITVKKNGKWLEPWTNATSSSPAHRWLLWPC